ncbi:MAG: universal stress protein [Candidatus Lambdaproteobacteria bacterium]|nr:universal stress protein [Candidatus Lambdaproteobacteria bacterium]
MLKRILIPLDTSEYTDSAIRIAVDMASQERAAEAEAVTLIGMGIVDMDQLPRGRFSSLVPREEIQRDAEAQVQERIAHFRQIARELGVREENIQTRMEEGSPFKKIIHTSVVCDMVAMGMRCSFPPINQDYESLSNLIHHASRPIVIADQNYQKIDKVVMVMDGTAPSSRMLYAYAQMNPLPLARVIMVHSQEEVAKYASLRGFFEQAATFLQEHRVTVELRAIDMSDDSKIAELVNAEGAEMIALGVHAAHFMDHLRDPLGLRRMPVENLLHATRASLFTVS